MTPRILTVLTVGLVCLHYGQPKTFQKRETSVKVQFVKSSTADWPASNAESFKKETPILTDHNPGDSANKRLTLTAFGKDWTISLQKNTMLYGKDMAFEIREPYKGGVMDTLARPADCFYIGTVEAGENEAGSAAVSTCNGKVTGTLITNLNDYMINPVIRKGRKRATDEDPIEMLIRHINSTIAEGRSRSKRSAIAEEILHQPLLRPDGRAIFFETGVVIDRSYTDELHSVLYIEYDELPRYVTDLFNAVQLWYLHPTLGYQVWLTLQKVIIIQYDIPVQGKTDLAKACGWQGKTFSDSANWDGTFLLTGDKSILGGIGGLAYPGTACGNINYHCAGILVNNHQSLMARSIAHEGAHVLGPMDDYVKPYSDVCYTGMMREGLYEDRDWSTCSVQMLEQFLQTKAKLTNCLLRESTPSLPSLSRPKFLNNVAWRSSAEQSSTYHSEVAWGAWKAVDGSITGVPHLDPNPVFGSCTRTQPEKDPWLMITLPKEHRGTTITTIHVYNREDCCADRLHDFEIRVGDNEKFQKNPLCHFHKGGVPGGRYGMVIIRCDNPLSGKYVSIQIKGGDREILTVCELMVYQDVQLPFYKNPNYSCADAIYGCAGAKRFNGCGGDHKKTNCAFTCGFCKREVSHPTIPTGTIHPPYSTDEPTCRDESRSCPHLVANGDCLAGDNMRRCPLSCNGCKLPTTTPATTTTTTSTTTTTTTTTEPPCLDQRPDCPGWASMGHCALNPVLLHVQCRKSCGLCKPETGCADQEYNCPAWAKAGNCESSPHIVQNCKKSCGAC
ncbi:A disintegrin and metalloproteinase with thrombospondin motifs 19-like [Lineus longissimus]|uniref:A disintegrin and metalloproteinase with thrombospondin motifs 19-like n=1 Tax=Lineus longissimus TaxID=88925 RepID=UPI002B4C5EA3